MTDNIFDDTRFVTTTSAFDQGWTFSPGLAHSMNAMNADWPQNADGDVLRRMRGGGFDFRKPCSIDFNIDFETWPPEEEAVRALKMQFPSAELVSPTAEFSGYIQFQMHELLTYDLVMKIQQQVTELMTPYGGSCESWGVLY